MIVTKKDISAAFGVNAYQVARWVEQGMPSRDGSSFALKEVIAWHHRSSEADLAHEKSRALAAEKEATASAAKAERIESTADRLRNELADLKASHETQIARLNREKDSAVRKVKDAARDRELKAKGSISQLKDEIAKHKQEAKNTTAPADQSTLDLEGRKLSLDCQIREEDLSKKQMERRVWEGKYVRVDDASLEISSWCQRIRLTLVQLADTLPTLVPGKFKATVKRDVSRRIQSALSEMYHTKICGLVVEEMMVLSAHLIGQEGRVDLNELLALLDDRDDITPLTIGSERFLPDGPQYIQQGRKSKKQATSTPRKKRTAKRRKAK